MRYYIILLLLALVSCVGKNVKDLHESIPRELGGWKAQGKDRYYDKETLYKYINGGAELYLTYDFKQALVRRYIGPADMAIVLDIYDMGKPSDAFGIFSIDREDESIGIGQDSEYGGGLLRFWKDRFFISIIAVNDELSTKPIMIELAKKVDHAISSIGLKPGLLKILPPEALRGEKTRFFHLAPVLNRLYFLAEENILKLNPQTDCVLAKYEQGTSSGFLLLVQYPDEGSAREAYQNFLASYMSEAKKSGIAQMENNTWTMVEINKNILVLALEAVPREFGLELLGQVKAKME